MSRDLGKCTGEDFEGYRASGFRGLFTLRATGLGVTPKKSFKLEASSFGPLLGLWSGSGFLGMRLLPVRIFGVAAYRFKLLGLYKSTEKLAALMWLFREHPKHHIVCKRVVFSRPFMTMPTEAAIMTADAVLCAAHKLKSGSLERLPLCMLAACSLEASHTCQEVVPCSTTAITPSQNARLPLVKPVTHSWPRWPSSSISSSCPSCPSSH